MDNFDNLRLEEQLLAAQKLNGGAQPPRPKRFQEVEHEPCPLTLK